MNQYRKKPVVIEAFQMTEKRRMDNCDWPNWLNRAWNKNEGDTGALFRKDMDAEMPDILCIQTLEGIHLVDWGDWIIQGVKGELYPCKPDIFEMTYEQESPGIERCAAPDKDAECVEKYNELIMAVGMKYPNETRHETALRYIRCAENPSRLSGAAMKEKP